MKNNLEPSPEERGRIVADAISKLPVTFQPTSLSSVEELLRRAIMISSRVGAFCRQIDAAAQTNGTKHDNKTLAKIISKEYLEDFGTWSKDELLYLIVFMHTDLAIDAMTGGTDTKSILSL